VLRRLVARLFSFDQELEGLREEVKRLNHDDAFGILTRQGLIASCTAEPGKKAVVFLDFDRIGDLNKELGYEEVNSRIKETFQQSIRQSDVLLGRWYSGDECLVLVDGDIKAAEAVLDRLRIHAQGQELSFMAATCPWDGNEEPLEHCVSRLAEEVLRQKAERYQAA